MVEGAVGDVKVRHVGEKVVSHQDAHEHEVVYHALELELERQLRNPRSRRATEGYGEIGGGLQGVSQGEA